MIYLDHGAATPLGDFVLDQMRPYFSDLFYNPSSPYMPAITVRHDYRDAKSRLARQLGGRENELIMTAGATESINLAFSVGEGQILTSAIEHKAVLAAAERHGSTDFISVDEYGRVVLRDLEEKITNETVLVSLSLANHEIGTIQPMREIADLVMRERQRRREAGESRPIYLHTDASQGGTQLDINVARLGVDMLTLNAGKIYGPKQVGLLWAAPHVVLSPLIVGGGQEAGLRSGTENVAGTVGFAVAFERAQTKRKSESERLAGLRDQMERRLIEAFPEMVISGARKHRLAGHLHISFPGLDGERLVFALESKGVLLATGSACAANKGTRSNVLMGIGASDEIADGSLRITLGALNNEGNIADATRTIIDVVRAEYERVSR